LTMLRIDRAETSPQIAIVRQLFQEYAASLGFHLCFQDFDRELRELPGEYALPTGCLLLASWETEAAGCVAMRPLSDGVCEMKRMYVRPAWRGKGFGRALAAAIIREARAVGYRRMRLDTISSMLEAVALYRSLGFADIEAYRYNPIEGAKFLELELQPSAIDSHPLADG
jgi:putative acetyltransferase